MHIIVLVFRTGVLRAKTWSRSKRTDGSALKPLSLSLPLSPKPTASRLLGSVPVEGRPPSDLWCGSYLMPASSHAPTAEGLLSRRTWRDNPSHQISGAGTAPLPPITAGRRSPFGPHVASMFFCPVSSPNFSLPHYSPHVRRLFPTCAIPFSPLHSSWSRLFQCS